MCVCVCVEADTQTGRHQSSPRGRLPGYQPNHGAPGGLGPVPNTQTFPLCVSSTHAVIYLCSSLSAQKYSSLAQCEEWFVSSIAVLPVSRFLSARHSRFLPIMARGSESGLRYLYYPMRTLQTCFLSWFFVLFPVQISKNA